MSSILGTLVGGLFGGGRQQKERSSSGGNTVTQRSQMSKSSADPNAPKAKAAGKLALIKTSASGVETDSATGRKKLLGN